MTDLEFDILDELYFVQSFESLEKTLELEPLTLKNNLQALIDKEWVKCFIDNTREVFKDEINLDKHYREYTYLATKQGLLAHHADD